MNNNGQLLLYDMLLAFMILLLVLISTTYLLETNDYEKINTQDYMEARYLLELTEDEKLLTKLSTALDKNDGMQIEQTIEKIDHILSGSSKDNYTLCDESINKTLINHSPTNYKNVYSGKKLINNHEYSLKIYH